MVLIEHWGPEWIYEKLHLGGLGVDLFFVLSGFLIGEILLVEKEQTTDVKAALKKFYIRRMLRIFPLYYITIITYGILFGTGGILLWNLTYTNNILECIDKSRMPASYAHLWSLSVEEQFYIVFPFLVFYLSRNNIYKVVIGGILLAIIGRALLSIIQVPDYYVINMRFTLFAFDCLFAGVLLAYLKTHKPAILQRVFSNGKAVLAAIVLLFVSVYIIRSMGDNITDNTFFRVGAASAGFLMIGYSVIKGFRKPLKLFLENRVIAYLGVISYGIYIFHNFVKAIYFQYLSDNGIKSFLSGLKIKGISNLYVIDFLSMFLITVLLSSLSYELMEKRFLKLKNKFA
ncbi:hypothetical protein CAP35_02620 [Chitinophagaceae bacterium IBVUCB1]|nr:hypothetical protein CAP35_02620 [Chitinophagaceae bacterium IBVUCB1]